MTKSVTVTQRHMATAGDVEEGLQCEVIEDEKELENLIKNGRKRISNPDNWKVKHIKKKDLRKNAPQKSISTLQWCCKRKCLSYFAIDHLEKIRDEFEQMSYEEST